MKYKSKSAESKFAVNLE